MAKRKGNGLTVWLRRKDPPNVQLPASLARGVVQVRQMRFITNSEGQTPKPSSSTSCNTQLGNVTGNTEDATTSTKRKRDRSDSVTEVERPAKPAIANASGLSSAVHHVDVPKIMITDCCQITKPWSIGSSNTNQFTDQGEASAIELEHESELQASELVSTGNDEWLTTGKQGYQSSEPATLQNVGATSQSPEFPSSTAGIPKILEFYSRRQA
ncbi:hypothetical protein D9758_005784 [Tetrapyrgos nigripes]|uniref:Uncharacterized protein n=1 Tax=Tetrapyrgos nigripes TaxID=182062 RepID=A0A8H5LQX0_9AGAR|nr:hypothetical protein D9758_005784 [Tetrapyrgos nigripes]